MLQNHKEYDQFWKLSRELIEREDGLVDATNGLMIMQLEVISWVDYV